MILAGKKIYLVANWKSHKTWDEAKVFMENTANAGNQTVVICPPMPYLFLIKEMAELKGIKIGAQDISNFPFGAYTGAVAAEMVKEAASYVIVGHSERRKYFGETNDMVANKARQTLEAGMTPIVCVDEPYLEAQLAFFEPTELKKMIIAYEPLAAIGSGQPDSPEHAEEIAGKIIRLVQVAVPVIYGGSVDTTNIRAFIDQEHISGALVGGASLEINTWNQLVTAIEK